MQRNNCLNLNINIFKTAGSAVWHVCSWYAPFSIPGMLAVVSSSVSNRGKMLSISITEQFLQSLWPPFILMLGSEPEKFLRNNSDNVISKAGHDCDTQWRWSTMRWNTECQNRPMYKYQNDRYQNSLNHLVTLFSERGLFHKILILVVVVLMRPSTKTALGYFRCFCGNYWFGKLMWIIACISSLLCFKE